MYLWADGLYFNVCLEPDRPCILVIMGATAEGKKELLAVWDGERESKESWRSVLRGLKRRGMRESPKLATGCAWILGGTARRVSGDAGATLLGPQDRQHPRQVTEAHSARRQEAHPRDVPRVYTR